MRHPYVTQQYAAAIAREGEVPCEIPAWDTWVVRRAIPDCGSVAYEDAAGCYPLVTFETGLDLNAGLEQLRALGLVSIVLVADPVLRPDEVSLAESFGLCRPFKTHYLFDRSRGEPVYSKHHRYELRRARAEVRQVCLVDHLAAWSALYEELCERRGISGPAAFPAEMFGALAKVEGLVTLAAFVDNALVACHLWIQRGAYVHSHLAASNTVGRACGAAYLLYDAAVQYFDDAEIIDFGGGAGYADNPDDGLARFKRGFSNAALPAYLCGEVLDFEKYRILCDMRGNGNSAYFPAYRSPQKEKAQRVL